MDISVVMVQCYQRFVGLAGTQTEEVMTGTLTANFRHKHSTFLREDDSEEWENTLDLSYFFGEDAKAIHANPVQYPDKSVIERCALMHDAGDMNEELVKMWNRVKGDNLSPLMLGVIIVVIHVDPL